MRHYSINQTHKESAEIDQSPSKLTPLGDKEPLTQVHKHKRDTKHKALPCSLISIEFKAPRLILDPVKYGAGLSNLKTSTQPICNWVYRNQKCTHSLSQGLVSEARAKQTDIGLVVNR